MAEKVDWYEQQHKLLPEQIFTTDQGDVVKLDRRVPGDGTRWYVADWWSGSWSYMDSTIEPGDLIEKFNNEQDALASLKGSNNV